MSSITATHGDAVRVLSSVFVIIHSDARNREYLISWLLKKVLNGYSKPVDSLNLELSRDQEICSS